MADGSVSGSSSSGSRNARPALLINLRADDRPWLEDVKRTLGGKLYEYDPNAADNSKRQVRWSAYGFTRVYPIVRLMLDVCTIHPRKRRELELVKEWCEWRMAWGNRLGKEGHRINQEYADRLSEYKAFKVPSYPG